MYTGLEFAHLGNGSVIAQYKSHHPRKIEAIRQTLTQMGYAPKVVSLLHTQEMMLQVVVGKNVKKDDYANVTTGFNTMWKTMRDDQKAAAAQKEEEDIDAMSDMS